MTDIRINDLPIETSPIGTDFLVGNFGTNQVTKKVALNSIPYGYPWTRSATGAVATTLFVVADQAEINPFDFMTTTQIADVRSLSPILDHTAHLVAAITALPNGGILRLRGPGVWNLSSVITTTDAAPIIIKGDGDCTILKKTANGDMFNLGKKSCIYDVLLNGNGSLYTGRGVIITNGGVDHLSWRHLRRCNIISMQSYPVEYTVAIAGYGSTIEHCVLSSTNAALGAVKYPVESNGNRRQISCNTSGPIAETAGTSVLLIFDCDGAPPVMTSSSVKVRVIGNRLATSAPSSTCTVDGLDTIYIGNTIGSTALVFTSTLLHSVYADNADTGVGATIADNSNGTNRIDLANRTATLYTPTWAATGGSPTIGNGSISGAWQRKGQSCKVNIVLTIGSTTNKVGTIWTLSVPYAAGRNQTGTVWVQQTGTGTKQYVGVCFIASGSSVMQFNVSGSTDPIGSAVPASWSTNDLLICDVEYLIQ